jgi:4-alpha-glucanotransferase
VLPLGPTARGNSPYASTSAFAGNPLLISLEKLVEAGWLAPERLHDLDPPSEHVDYEAVVQKKMPLLEEAARNFLAQGAAQGEVWRRFENFCSTQRHWLNDYTFSVVLRNRSNAGGPSGPAEIRRHNPEALSQLHAEDGRRLCVEQALQFAFDEQWHELRRYCAKMGVRILGDVAIFVNLDSVDVWTTPEIFELNENMEPTHVSGVPPDYFSPTGQRWGNPLYRWDQIELRGFDWWVSRIRRATELYDLVRLDHFRGFEAFWRIPGSEETAIHGEWVKAPGGALFAALRESLGELPFIAEDLGLITPEVTALREQFGMPGMRVLQFGFGDKGSHMHLPHQATRNTVFYTGTHDNDTMLGWWQNGANEQERRAVEAYLRPGDDGVVWAMIRAAAASVADLCIMPAQDVLGLGSDARMNTPSQPEANWTWRMRPDALTPELAAKLAVLMTVSDRDAHFGQPT